MKKEADIQDTMFSWDEVLDAIMQFASGYIKTPPQQRDLANDACEFLSYFVEENAM